MFVLTLEPFSGVRLDPAAPKCVIFLLLRTMKQLQGFWLHFFSQCHMSSEVKTDPRKRETSVILKMVLGLIISLYYVATCLEGDTTFVAQDQC